jgi:hypothetical protein
VYRGRVAHSSKLVHNSVSVHAGEIATVKQLCSDLVRYHFYHELLANDVSYFAGAHVQRDRRISVICRDQPKVENIEKFDHVKSREMDKKIKS